MSFPPLEAHGRDLERVLGVLRETPALDREYLAPREEFESRVRRVNQTLERHGLWSAAAPCYRPVTAARLTV